MATVAEIIERARRRIRVQGAEEPTAAHEAEQARQALNDMLHAWTNDGTIASHTNFDELTDVATVNATDTIALTDEANEALTACLAIRLCDEYGLPQPPAVVSHCDLGKRSIAARKFTDTNNPIVAEFDTGLLLMPSQRREYW